MRFKNFLWSMIIYIEDQDLIEFKFPYKLLNNKIDCLEVLRCFNF